VVSALHLTAWQSSEAGVLRAVSAEQM
jgi:hypothetical protein